MILIAFALCVLAGWFGWPNWVAIPLGLFIFAGASQGQAYRAGQISLPVAIVVGSLIAYGLMWVGRMLEGFVA
jgi:hypothetical protein